MSVPHPDAERLTLAALPAEQADPEVAAHLLECAQCRAEVDELRRTVELARADGVGEPLPIPPTRVWQAILDELADDDPVGAGTPDRDGHAPAVRPSSTTSRSPTAGDGDPRRRRRRAAPPARPWWRRSLVGVAAAAVVGLGLGVGIGVGVGGSGDEPEPTPVVQLGPVGHRRPAAPAAPPRWSTATATSGWSSSCAA